MSKTHPQIFIALVAAGLAVVGIVQYLAISGLIALSVLSRIHFIFYPAYAIAGAFGVMFQWFLIAAVFVSISRGALKRKREQAEPEAPARHEPAPAGREVVHRSAGSFGRRGRA